MQELTVDAAVENISVITDFVNRALDARSCPPETKLQIDVAIDEAVSNVAHYAYESGRGTIRVCIDWHEVPLTAVLTFADSGIPYNPLQRKDPDITLCAQERPIGGLGIFILKKIMDKVEYRYENGQNILVISKQISCESDAQ